MFLFSFYFILYVWFCVILWFYLLFPLIEKEIIQPSGSKYPLLLPWSRNFKRYCWARKCEWMNDISLSSAAFISSSTSSLCLSLLLSSFLYTSHTGYKSGRVLSEITDTVTCCVLPKAQDDPLWYSTARLCFCVHMCVCMCLSISLLLCERVWFWVRQIV